MRRPHCRGDAGPEQFRKPHRVGAASHDPLPEASGRLSVDMCRGADDRWPIVVYVCTYFIHTYTPSRLASVWSGRGPLWARVGVRIRTEYSVHSLSTSPAPYEVGG